MASHRTILRDPSGHWPMHSHHMLPALGLHAGAHLPDAGLPARIIQGIHVWVISKADARARGVFHRVRCACPYCGDDVPAGRLSQHVTIHPDAPAPDRLPASAYTDYDGRTVAPR